MKKILAPIIVITLVVAAIFLYFRSQKTEQVTFRKVSGTWTKALTSIHDNWLEGVDINDPVLLDNCPEFNNLKIRPTKELLACRSTPFKCFYKNRKNKVVTNKVPIAYKVSFPKENVDQENYWSLPFDLTINKEKKRFYLSDKCLTADIPDQVYNHGRFIVQKNFWRPGDVNYWVDKYLVRNIDILYWAQQTGNKVKFNKNGLFAAATFNSSKPMKNFCQYRKSVVLNTMLADAVTYYGVDDKRAVIMNKNQSPYPFSVRKQNVSHAKMLKNSNYQIKEEDCQKIFTSECIDLNFKASPAESLGWSGVGELLGGPLEFVVNHFNPRRNLMLSSKYFSLSSRVHKAAERGYWSELGATENDFSFFVESPRYDGEYEVSFRCMGVIN